MTIPRDDPRRYDLNNEVHARPPDALTAPARLSYLALLSPLDARDAERQKVAELIAPFGIAPPSPGINHFSADLGSFRLRWERHTEFTRYQFTVPGEAEPFATPAIDLVPADWISALPGETIVATNVAMTRAGTGRSDYEAISARHFQGNSLVGSSIGAGAGVAITDFRIHTDGFGRILVEDAGLTPRQAGRMVQRLLEIDTYRMLALLALPVARTLVPFLEESERELATITNILAHARDKDEGALLERLTRLEAEVGDRASRNHYRFSAAAAYYELVRNRIDELREVRLEGFQTFREFTERRLAPAMNTCRAVARRQEALSQRAARTTQLLSTRVDISRERQNHAVLASMNRRASMQLRLQETVEGLSIAAVTYYVVAIIGYGVKGLHSAGFEISPELVMGLSIPFVLFFAWLGLRRIRRSMTKMPE
jgi:uncharacterized membrane-anchored protein